MADEIDHDAQKEDTDPEGITFTLSIEDIERLIRGIDRKLIIDLVRHDKSLQQNFSGFRPNSIYQLPNVSTRLARGIHGNKKKINRLMVLWRMTNKSLSEKVTQEVNIETIKDDVVNLFDSENENQSRLAHKRDLILWALLFDKRKEIQTEIANGLKDALVDESSWLMAKVNYKWMKKELEKAHGEILDLKSKIEESKAKDQHLKDESERANKLQDEYQQLQDLQKNLKLELKETTQQKDIASQKIKELQNELVQEKKLYREQKKLLNEKENTFKKAIEENAELKKEVVLYREQKKLLNEKENTLKKAIEENPELKKKIVKIEKDLENAIAEWEKESEHAKSLIDQLEKAKAELNESKKFPKNAQAKQNTMLPSAELDKAWYGALNKLTTHLRSITLEPKDINGAIQSNERWIDWQKWQKMETEFVKPVLEASNSASASEAELANTEHAQRLLMLRWYLLEWTKLTFVIQ